MNFKAALLYNGGIAFYNVYHLYADFYKAKLDECSCNILPPLLIELYKNNQHWKSDCNDKELIQELAAAIEYKKA